MFFSQKWNFWREKRRPADTGRYAKVEWALQIAAHGAPSMVSVKKHENLQRTASFPLLPSPRLLPSSSPLLSVFRLWISHIHSSFCRFLLINLTFNYWFSFRIASWPNLARSANQTKQEIRPFDSWPCRRPRPLRSVAMLRFLLLSLISFSCSDVDLIALSYLPRVLSIMICWRSVQWLVSWNRASGLWTGGIVCLCSRRRDFCLELCHSFTANMRWNAS